MVQGGNFFYRRILYTEMSRCYQDNGEEVVIFLFPDPAKYAYVFYFSMLIEYSIKSYTMNYSLTVLILDSVWAMIEWICEQNAFRVFWA